MWILIHDLAPAQFSGCKDAFITLCLPPPSAFANACEMHVRACACTEERVFARAEAFCLHGFMFYVCNAWKHCGNDACP